MTSNYDNFKAWFKDILEGFYSNRNAGFVILMVAFPLLERYLREKSGIHEGSYNDNFYKELAVIFPELRYAQDAKDFWQVYRNGLLHQGTLSQKNRSGIKMPDAWVSNDSMAAVSKNGTDFWVHPANFARHVIDIIEKDFPTFEGRHSTAHPLPTISQFPNNVLGTGASGP